MRAQPILPGTTRRIEPDHDKLTVAECKQVEVLATCESYHMSTICIAIPNREDEIVMNTAVAEDVARRILRAVKLLPRRS